MNFLMGVLPRPLAYIFFILYILLILGFFIMALLSTKRHWRIVLLLMIAGFLLYCLLIHFSNVEALAHSSSLYIRHHVQYNKKPLK